jgi:predicted membrane channel-forming protein YqfA (hemolysin III family)
VVYQLAVKLAVGGVTLLAVGGVVYSLGVIFYVTHRQLHRQLIDHDKRQPAHRQIGHQRQNFKAVRESTC